MTFTTAYKTFHKDELAIYAEIISTEAHISLEGITESLERFFSETGEDQVTVMYYVPVEDSYDSEIFKVMLENVMDRMEYVVSDIKAESRCYNRQFWHTNHKNGKPRKPVPRPTHWHRIRSFCVRNNYH